MAVMTDLTDQQIEWTVYVAQQEIEGVLYTAPEVFLTRLREVLPIVSSLLARAQKAEADRDAAQREMDEARPAINHILAERDELQHKWSHRDRCTALAARLASAEAKLREVGALAEQWRNVTPAGFYPEASAHANAVENCGDALIDLLSEAS